MKATFLSHCFCRCCSFASFYQIAIYLTEEIFRKAAVKLELVILNFLALDLTKLSTRLENVILSIHLCQNITQKEK